MPDLDTSLAGVHAAVAALVGAADSAGAQWAVPRAPGKWSPSQTIEHVTRIMDESAKVAAGAPSKFPTFPRILRPIVRMVFFRRVLKNNAFPEKSKTINELDPASDLATSATPAEARVRLEAVLTRFEQACRARAASGQDVESTMFGGVPVSEFAKLQELHVRHHLTQMPGTA